MTGAALLHDGRDVLQAALDAVSPAHLISEIDLDLLLKRPLTSYPCVAVVGAGKAAMAMAGALEKRYADRSWAGAVAVPHGYPETFPSHEVRPRNIAVRTAGHPIPDAASAIAAADTLRVARSLNETDLLVMLLSGGASALWGFPVEEVEIADLRILTQLLLDSGAHIHEVNAVRKHLSSIAGGRLAEAAAPATVVTLAISDVPGDDPASIGSGPTVADPSTFSEALAVLQRYELFSRTSPSIVRILEAGSNGDVPETLKHGSSVFDRSGFHILARNDTALEAADAAARAAGYVVERASITGDARDAGRQIAERLMRVDAGRVCHLYGGETTVTVRGNGRGGRNQELALAAALALDGISFEALILSAGTDGIDGPTDVAGAWADERTAKRARGKGADPENHLRRNDAYPLFDLLGQLIHTGPTHTNVMDIVVALAHR